MAGLRIRFDAGANQRAQREREAARAAKTKAKSDLAAQTRGLDIRQQQADTAAMGAQETIDARLAKEKGISLLKFTAENATDLEIGVLRTPDDIEFVKWLSKRVDRNQKYNEKNNTTLGQLSVEALQEAEKGNVGVARQIMKNAARVAAESGTKSPGYMDISGADRTKLGLGLTDDQQEQKAKVANNDALERDRVAKRTIATAQEGRAVRAEDRLIAEEATEATTADTEKYDTTVGYLDAALEQLDAVHQINKIGGGDWDTHASVGTGGSRYWADIFAETSPGEESNLASVRDEDVEIDKLLANVAFGKGGAEKLKALGPRPTDLDLLNVKYSDIALTQGMTEKKMAKVKKAIRRDTENKLKVILDIIKRDFPEKYPEMVERVKQYRGNMEEDAQRNNNAKETELLKTYGGNNPNTSYAEDF